MILTCYFDISNLKRLRRGERGIIVFDIDDTLLRASKSSNIHVWKMVGGDPNNRIALSTSEFAMDPDAKDPKKSHWFDYHEYRDPIKVRKSILEAEPIIGNLKIMDAYINAGYDFAFLTARGLEEVVAKALYDFLNVRDKNGKLRKLGRKFRRDLSCAVNDDDLHYEGVTDADKKANVLRRIATTYHNVVFVDDDDKNLHGVLGLNMPNIVVVKAFSK